MFVFVFGPLKPYTQFVVNMMLIYFVMRLWCLWTIHTSRLCTIKGSLLSKVCCLLYELC